jgi:hypothetical protein
MKKQIVLILILLFILVNGIPVAAEDISTGTNAVVLNEYEIMKRLKSASDKELLDLGITHETISKIRDFDFEAAVKERAKLDKQTLRNMGYNEAQIAIFKSFSGTEKELEALSANCQLTAEKEGFWYYDYTDTTNFAVSFEWEWSHMPFWEFTDIIGFGWSNDFILHENNPYTYHRVNYRSIITGNINREQFPIEVEVPGENAKSLFPISRSYEWAESGYGWIHLEKRGRHLESQMRIAYGHNVLKISNPSLSYPFGVGFSFGIGINLESDDVVYDHLYK